MRLRSVVVTLLALGCAFALAAQVTPPPGPVRLWISASNPPSSTQTTNPVVQVSDTPNFIIKQGFFSGLNQPTGGKVLIGPATWKSSQTGIATINANSGVATAVSAGQSFITGQRGPFFGTSTLTVGGAALNSITVAPSTATIPKGSNQQYTATGVFASGPTMDISDAVTFGTSNSAIGTVSTMFGTPGIAVGVAQGGPINVTATLGAVIGSGQLTVSPPVLVSVNVTPSNPMVTVPATQQFAATGVKTDSSTTNLTGTATWGSSDMTVATINSSGLASTLKAGTSTISALDVPSGLSGNTLLTVNPSGFGNSGDPYQEEGPPSMSDTLVNSCRTFNTSAPSGHYRVTTNLTSNAGAGTCFVINARNVVLDLGGFTINGRIDSTFTNTEPSGLHLFNGTVNCNFPDSGQDIGCITINNQSAITAQTVFHHLTLLNTAGGASTATDLSLNWRLPGVFGGAPFSLRLHHITASSPSPVTNRSDVLSVNGNNQNVEYANNDITCGNVRACEGTICFAVNLCSIHDSRYTMTHTTADETGRAILIDGDCQIQNPCSGVDVTQNAQVFNNQFTANNNRAVRVRNSTNVSIHDNTVKMIQDAGTTGGNYVAAMHLGDPDVPIVDSLNLTMNNNSFEIDDGRVMMIRDTTGSNTVSDNTFTCILTCATNQNLGDFAFIRRQTSNATNVLFQRNTPANGIPQPWIMLEPGTSATVCKSGPSGSAAIGGSVTYTNGC